MKNLVFSETEYNNLLETIKLFWEIYGDDEKPLELEDYFSLVNLGRSIIWMIEESIE